jgi:hypothetical protein
MNTNRNLTLGRTLLTLVVLAAFGVRPGAPAVAADHSASPLPFEGFACCTLHYEGDWIGDGHYAALPSIPAATPITLLR